MLKPNQIDAKWISVVDAKIKYFQNPLYFNISFPPPSKNKKNFLLFGVFSFFLVQIFVLIGDDWAAEG